MVAVCNRIFRLCCGNIDFGKGRHRTCQFQSRYSDSTAVMLCMAWGMVFLTHAQAGLADISRKSWIFLILSGLATGASWLCYYYALQKGEVSKVVPIDKLSVVITMVFAFIFLHEQFTTKSIIGALLITAGTLLMVL